MSGFVPALDASWRALAAAAPWVLFGLGLAGLLHVLLPRGLVQRWLGRPGLSGVARGAWLGLPLPLCSCSVVPVALAMRKKGATRPACLSLLITTPESSVDSVILTWGLLGPVMAIARPVAALLTAFLAGAASLALEDDERDPAGGPPDRSPSSCDHPHRDHPGNGHSHGLDDAADAEAALGRRDLVAWLRSLPRRLAGPLRPGDPTLQPIWHRLGRPALRSSRWPAYGPPPARSPSKRARWGSSPASAARCPRSPSPACTGKRPGRWAPWCASTAACWCSTTNPPRC